MLVIYAFFVLKFYLLSLVFISKTPARAKADDRITGGLRLNFGGKGIKYSAGVHGGVSSSSPCVLEQTLLCENAYIQLEPFFKFCWADERTRMGAGSKNLMRPGTCM